MPTCSIKHKKSIDFKVFQLAQYMDMLCTYSQSGYGSTDNEYHRLKFFYMSHCFVNTIPSQIDLNIFRHAICVYLFAHFQHVYEVIEKYFARRPVSPHVLS